MSSLAAGAIISRLYHPDVKISRTASYVRFTSTPASWNAQIVWKNSQIDRSRKFRFRAPSLICAGNRHDEAHGKRTRGKTARSAEPLPNFPSRPSMAV
jgi:hypothetical protein